MSMSSRTSKDLRRILIVLKNSGKVGKRLRQGTPKFGRHASVRSYPSFCTSLNKDQSHLIRELAQDRIDAYDYASYSEELPGYEKICITMDSVLFDRNT
ncbi:hypothetical protein TNCV_2312561 [Trichonephila clavipes]|nr:hypothetical protein TNCV_2312561 [Trichonephila clavipes]